MIILVWCGIALVGVTLYSCVRCKKCLPAYKKIQEREDDEQMRVVSAYKSYNTHKRV